MSRLAIIDGVRTPFCKAGTELKALPAQDLGRIVVSEVLERTSFKPGKISQVIFGCVAQPAEAANIARVIALNAGIPDSSADDLVLARDRQADAAGDGGNSINVICQPEGALLCCAAHPRRGEMAEWLKAAVC